MSVEMLAGYIETFQQFAEGSPWLILLFVFVFMAIESSLIPFPSEVVMIPAGVLIYRGALPLGNDYAVLAIVIFAGTLGALAGAYANYYLAVWLGRPFLYKYGKYFFLPEKSLQRSEEIFRKHGSIVTFVCRLLPTIRQLISLPAGLARMNHKTFSFYTVLGAGIWNIILTLIGYFLGSTTEGKSWHEIILAGQNMISEHYIWLILGLAAIIALYMTVQHFVMKSDSGSVPEHPETVEKSPDQKS